MQQKNRRKEGTEEQKPSRKSRFALIGAIRDEMAQDCEQKNGKREEIGEQGTGGREKLTDLEGWRHRSGSVRGGGGESRVEDGGAAGVAATQQRRRGDELLFKTRA